MPVYLSTGSAGEPVRGIHYTSQLQAESYLQSDLFNHDVVVALKPYLMAAPEIRIYTSA
jgi:hypothetical protein